MYRTTKNRGLSPMSWSSAQLGVMECVGRGKKIREKKKRREMISEKMEMENDEK